MLLIYYTKFLFPYFQILFVPWHVISNQQPLSDWIHTEMSNYIENSTISP